MKMMTARMVMMMLNMVAGVRPETLLLITPTFRFHQVIDDPDDDKFVDCAIAAEADYLITSDGHFEVLIGSGYKPQPITPEDFIRQHLAPT
jgi:predicted nucleic acid-binding protein